MPIVGGQAIVLAVVASSMGLKLGIVKELLASVGCCKIWVAVTERVYG